MIKNYMEIHAENILRELLQRDDLKDICKCEHCLDDMLSIALNNLPPLYVTTKTGEVFSEYAMKDYQHISDIKQELIKAIDKVAMTAHR